MSNVREEEQLTETASSNCMLDEQEQTMHDRYGNVLFKLLLGLIPALIIIQLLLHYEPSRPYFSPIQQMEGIPVNEPNVNVWMGENTSSLLHHSS